MVFSNQRTWTKKKYFFHGKFQYPGLCFACLLAFYNPRGRTRASKTKEAEMTERKEGGGNRRPRDTLERFFFVRDSSRHRGITSFCWSVFRREPSFVPANLILKPRVRVTECDEKNKRNKGSPRASMGNVKNQREKPLPFTAFGVCLMIIGISVTLGEGCALLSHAIFTDSLFYVSARTLCSVGSTT